MEKGKLRGISIIAAEAFDSEKPRGLATPVVRAVAADALLLTRSLSGTFDSEKPRGIVIPAVRADALLLTRSLSGTFSSSGSVPIRAPVTVAEEDDDDSGSVTDERNLGSIDAGSYSKGLDSGTDDGFESVSGVADDENELGDVVMGGTRVHGVLGEEEVGETGDGSDLSGGSVVVRPTADDAEDETSVNYSSLEEESENSEGVSESDVSEVDGVSMNAKVVIPRAILSFNDDEFDEILGSGDDETALLREYPGDEETEVEDKRVHGDMGMVDEPESSGSVIRGAASIEEETEVEDRALQFGDMRMVDEPECSDSVITEFISTEEEAVGMNYSDKLEDGLISFGNIKEHSLGVPSGGSTDLMVENEGNSIEASIGLDGSFKQLIEKEVVYKTSVKEDGDGSIESVALIKLGDVVGVEDSAVESGEMGMTDKSECSDSVTGELVSTEEDTVQMKSSEDGVLALDDCNELLVESEGNAVDADHGLDETFTQVVKGVGHGCVSKESNDRLDDDSSSDADADEWMIPGEGRIGLGSRESGNVNTENMIGESKEHCENDCTAVCEGEHEIGMSSGGFQLTPTQDSVTRNLEVARGVDVLSGCCSSDQKAGNEGKQESENTLPNEDRASSLRSSFETANESVENGEQSSEQVDKQVNVQSDNEPNQVSVGTEKTSLRSDKDVETTMPENSCVAANDVMENEPEMIHNHTFMELDEYERTGHTKEKLSESTPQSHSEDSSPDHSVQLISGKVKERVEKTKLLKEKLQSIIGEIGGLCSEISAVTEVESQQSLVGGEHQTSLGLDDASNGTKTMLLEQEFPVGPDFSINVLVIGRTGVGKSATVNSIFGETKSAVGAFEVTTKSANYLVGNVRGILMRILDTPGLTSSATEERFNHEVLMSIKKSMRTFPVDVILYIDRLDENPDIHLLKTITSSLGSSIWRNAIVVLTHAASDVPDSSSYKDLIAQRSSLTHQSIRQAVPELSCVDRSKMPVIVLAENNMSSLFGNKTNESTCQDWRLNLLILCCSVKNRSKAGSLLKQNTLVEKHDAFGSPLRSFTLFCSLWNVLILGANTGQASHSLDELEEKKRRLLESYPEILWDEQSQECLEQETLPVKNQEPEDEERRRHEKGKRNMSVRTTRRGRLGFQAKKRFGIYCDLHTGFSIGDYRKHEQDEEGRMLMRMRGSSMAVLGLVPMLMSVLASVYGRKDT